MTPSDSAMRGHIVRVTYSSCRPCVSDAFFSFPKNNNRPPPLAAKGSRLRHWLRPPSKRPSLGAGILAATPRYVGVCPLLCRNTLSKVPPRRQARAAEPQQLCVVELSWEACCIGTLLQRALRRSRCSAGWSSDLHAPRFAGSRAAEPRSRSCSANGVADGMWGDGLGYRHRCTF